MIYDYAERIASALGISVAETAMAGVILLAAIGCIIFLWQLSADDDEPPMLEEYDSVIQGRAYVTDGDGININQCRIRLAGLDAPELGQIAVAADGELIDQGEIAKAALIRKIGGQYVEVQASDIDIYGRVVGTVWFDERDINREMVLEGFAHSCYGRQYRREEHYARRFKRGFWSCQEMTHPAEWRRAQ